MFSMEDFVHFVFPPLTTHLKHVQNDQTSSLFPYDGLIAVAAVTYCRYTVKYNNESRTSRLFWSAVLGYLSYNRYDYWIQALAHLFSFAVHFYEKANAFFANVSMEISFFSHHFYILTNLQSI